ncbi:MAG: response regulator [Candidatus Eremiobacteraeota bacterium]|nr:response regulator [Candidatus Eremiobacteraeota bacterium]
MLNKRKRILLVDDEEFIRKLTRATLTSASYEIQEAENGKQALEMAQKIQPDLILLDVTMPGISGYEVCRRIKADPHMNTYIVMLTGNTEEWVKEKGIKAGADDFFVKPFSPIQLLNKVHSHFYKECIETDISTIPKSSQAYEVTPTLEVHRIRTREELSKLKNEQLMLYAMDLSKIYQNEFAKTRELNKAYEKLKEMEKMKDIFIALVSHELRTPLSIIKGYLYLLQEVLNKSSLKDDISGFLTPIFKATNRLEELMGELLDFSCMKSGLMTFEKREIHLPSLMNLIMEDYQSQFDAKGIKTNLEFESDFRPIKADYERLKEALSHFVHNALNFTDSGGTFDIRCRDEGIFVIIEFQDTGKGIPEDKKDKVFSPFYQVADFLTRHVGGMGLGLSIAKHVVEDHGGSVSLESQVGKGSIFTIKLPRSYQDAREIVAELNKTYPRQIEELSRNLKDTQEQLLSYAHELSEVFARERKNP